MTKYFSILTIVLIAFSACKKEKIATCTDGIKNQSEHGVDCGGPCKPCSEAPQTIKVFRNVEFDSNQMFFATNGSSGVALDSASAVGIAEDIDITYTWDGLYNIPGFLDARVRSDDQYTYTLKYLTKWTKPSREINWYITSSTSNSDEGISAATFDAKRLNEYFNTPGYSVMTQHISLPDGKCIGGYNGIVVLSAKKIYAFQRVSDGKRGLMEIVSMPNTANYSKLVVNILVEV